LTLHDDDATRERIAQARSSASTRPCLDRLELRDFAALLDARAVDARRPFLVAYDERGGRTEISYTELVGRVLARARTLAKSGVRRGDRIAGLFHNDPEVAITAFAAWRLGACFVPVNLGEDDDRIAFVLENSESRAAVLLADHAERARILSERVPSVKSWLRTDLLSEEPLDLAQTTDLPRPHGEDEALVVYTSGTTGAPKGVVLTQSNLLVDADGIARWHGAVRDARWMCVLPTHHVNGLVVTLVTPFWFGGSVVLCRRFRTADFWSRIAQERVQVVSVVPTLLAFLLEDAPRAEGLDLRALRHLICGAGPLTVDLARRFEERFGVRIVHGYGLSETTCYSCFLPLDLDSAQHAHWMRDFGFPSIGVPIESNEMEIHDPAGRALAPGERGEIAIRGVNVMKGYWRRPEANAETFAHGWFRSGDEGFFQRDERGRTFFFITGRLKELIIRGGVNLSPFEIDEVLSAIPGVARGLAVGFENTWYGEEVGAYVVPLPGARLDEAAILRACRERLPFGKSPKVVVFGTDIPVTATGKYQRGRLVGLFAAFKDVQFRDAR
jgi:long-chain acyl-CoA synthetase